MTAALVRWLWRGYIVTAVLFVFAPAFSLLVFSFQANRIQSFPITRFTTNWYRNAWENPEVQAGLQNSIFVGVTAGLAAATLGFLSAHLLARALPKYGSSYLALVSLPVFVPLLLSGIALLMYYQRIHLAGSLWAIIAAHSCYCSPFALAVIRGPYERLNPELEQAARNLGAGWGRITFQIVVPQLWPAIIAAMLVSFLLSWDEFVLAWFVGGFQRTLPVVIYGMMGASFNPSLNAVGAVSVAVSGGILAAVFLLEGLATRRAKAT
jgi:spermidine/putrescine transport system permease protein